MAKKKSDPVKRKKYYIKPSYIGKKFCTIAPINPARRLGGMFWLDDKLTQKELEYLYIAIGYAGIEYK